MGPPLSEPRGHREGRHIISLDSGCPKPGPGLLSSGGQKVWTLGPGVYSRLLHLFFGEKGTARLGGGTKGERRKLHEWKIYFPSKMKGHLAKKAALATWKAVVLA